ncbi:7080_t:CDS:2, partial [Entrophospora sp. SA101]
HPLLKVKQIYDIRWLSWYDAVKTFLYFLYDILGYLSELSKVFQKRFIRFSDLQPTIEATLEKIQHEYLEDNPRLGYNLSGFLTNISPTSNLYIGNHKLIFNNGYEDDLMVDICEFASSIIVEIKERFPNPKLLSAMKILNPQEWPKDKEFLMFYGELELKELVSVYGKSIYQIIL